jgi:hypothetical protein
LLDKVNVELGVLINPKAQDGGKGLFLPDGRMQEARDGWKMRCDSTPTGAAQSYAATSAAGVGSSQLVSQYGSTKLRLAEVCPKRRSTFSPKCWNSNPQQGSQSNAERVIKGKAERDRRIRLLDTMQQARSLWTLRVFDCIRLRAN